MHDETIDPLLPYRGCRVLVTGHTGFKGSWLTLWLHSIGARVVGYSLAPPTTPSLFEAARVDEYCEHLDGDVRDLTRLKSALEQTAPEIIFHLAAQPLVRRSYSDPLETLDVNVMGTAHLLEAVRQLHLRCAIVVVTSDKCYENKEWDFGYRETDPMGGYDVYSMSKGAAELVVASFRRSFFHPKAFDLHGVGLASARAGNVIGGGDWGEDRLVPDVVRAMSRGTEVLIRNPRAVRPWQHVLEPLHGYLILAAQLLTAAPEQRYSLCDGWNFGPTPNATCDVAAFVNEFIALLGGGEWREASDSSEPHEARLLRLSIDKAVTRLAWRPRWTLEQALQYTAVWYQEFSSGVRGRALAEICRNQILAYTSTTASAAAPKLVVG